MIIGVQMMHLIPFSNLHIILNMYSSKAFDLPGPCLFSELPLLHCSVNGSS